METKVFYDILSHAYNEVETIIVISRVVVGLISCAANNACRCHVKHLRQSNIFSSFKYAQIYNT